MLLKKKVVLNSLIMFTVFFFLLQPCLSAEDILNITISDFEPTLEVLQGECKAAPFHITNRYSETVHIIFRIDNPSDMNVTSYPKYLTMLNPGQSVAGNLKFCVDEYFENNTYNISFWLDSTTKVNDSRVRSDEYTLGVTVLNNPEITTTSTTIETTTVMSQVTSTTTIYMPVNTTTIKEFDTDVEDMDKSTGNLFERDKLVKVGVIIIALVLIMIPYFTFIKGRKAKIEGS